MSIFSFLRYPFILGFIIPSEAESRRAEDALRTLGPRLRDNGFLSFYIYHLRQYYECTITEALKKIKRYLPC